MIHFLFFTSLILNLISFYILYRVWKEKRFKYSYEYNQAWQELLTVLNDGIEIRVNDWIYLITKDNVVYKQNRISSLSELEDDFQKENKFKVKKYSVKKELDRWK